MPIPVTCGSCNKQYQAKDSLAGKRIKCQKCGAAIEIPNAAPAAAPPPQPEAPAKIAVACGSCGKQFQAGAHLAGKRVKCPQCSEPLTIPAAGESASQPVAKPARRPVAKKTEAAAPLDTPAPLNAIGSILDEEFAAGAMPNVAVAGQKYCVNCKAIIAADAFFCVYCGFDERAGKSMTMQGTVVKVKKPGHLPVLGYLVAVLALLFGLGHTVGNGYFAYRCLLILIDKGLPDGTDPQAALGLFGTPVFVLLTIASFLMLLSAVGILMHRKGSAGNAALASSIFMGFIVFLLVVLGAAMAMGANKMPDDPNAKAGTFAFLTMQVFTQILINTMAYWIVPALVWTWWKFQGRHVDWELPEPERKQHKSATGAPPSTNMEAKAQAAEAGIARASALRKVKGPAIVFQVVGWLNLVAGALSAAALIVIIIMAIQNVGFGPVMEQLLSLRFGLQLVSMAVSFALGAFVLSTGRNMKQLEGYVPSMIVAVLMCLGCLMPFGIWALVVLLQDDVKKSFR